MKKKLFILFFSTLFSNCVLAQWQKVFLNSSTSLNSVYFINNDTGFVCGYYKLYKTIDGGQNWIETNLPFSPTSIQFVNDYIGYTGGQDGLFYGSNDGGDSWYPLSPTGFIDDFSAFYFINRQVGFVIDFSGTITKTINGGITWENIFLTSGASYFPGTAKFFFVDTLLGYVASSDKTKKSIAKTIDGGNTWLNLNVPENFYPNSIYFFDSLSGISVGKRGKIAKTYDGGYSWTKLDSICPYTLFDVFFVNDSVGYISGGFNSYDFVGTKNGIIYKTTDRGNTWQIDATGYKNGLTKLSFPSDTVGYVVGVEGIVLKLGGNSQTASVPYFNTIDNSISLSPNPTSGQFTIESLSFQNKKIVVYNILGEIIYQSIITQSNKLIVDLSTQPKGIYFVQINIDGDVLFKKIIVE